MYSNIKIYILKLHSWCLAIKSFTTRVNEDLNIKVSDFGLARDVYTTDYYRHKGGEKLPVKWMAIEALKDRISNEKTDVVSDAVI